MGFFSSKRSQQSYIGLDLGMSGIKLVELLNEKGRARLVTYAYADYPDMNTERNYTERQQETSELVKRMVSQAKTTTKRVIAALPISSVFSSIISVPASNDKELKEAIEWQAKKLIPMPLEEISLDSKELDSESGGEKEKKEKEKVTRVLLTGAPKGLVKRYVDILTSAGLEPLALETEAFAQIRSLVGRDRSTVMIIDIGAFRTNLTVVEKGVPFLSRSIAAGGSAITTTIAKTIGIPFEQAETMKRDIKAMQAFAPTGDLSPILATLLKPILDEIKYSFNLYQGQRGNGAPKRIDKIIVTGGSSLLPRLPEFLTDLMNVNTYRGDPWARVVYPEDLRPVLDEIGSRMAVSVGCAMRDIE